MQDASHHHPTPPAESSAGEDLAARLREAPYFILPDGTNRELVATLGRRFLDLTLDAVATAERRPLLPSSPSSAGPARAEDDILPADYSPPLRGRDPEELIAHIRARVLDRVMNVAHPGYVGHMDTLPSAIGAFSDMLVSALNNNMLCWEMSPVFTEMEARLLAWVTRTIGWNEPPEPGDDRRRVERPASARSSADRPTGFLVSGGSLANLSALLAARNVMCGPGFRERGLQAAPGPPVILASEEVHYSLDKIVNILGLGARGLVRVATDRQMRMRPDALRTALQDVRREGRWPFAVVGIAGTTVTGAIDPLAQIGALARREGLWFHVDAAYGGSLLICPRERPGSRRELLAGIETADSVTFNPQKWLFVPKVCAGVFFRDSLRVDEAVRQSFPYAGLGNGPIDDPRRNVGEYTVQGTRRVDVLKLWLTLEHFGLDLLADLMADSLERAQRLTRHIAAQPELELLAEPQLNIVCFRYRPPGMDGRRDGEALDELNLAIHRRLRPSGPGWIAIPRHRGRRWLRFVVLHPLARDDRLAQIVDEVIAAGRAVVAEHTS